MIRISRTLVDRPPTLAVDGRSATERQQTLAHFMTASTADTPFKKFRSYKADDVKSALRVLFGEKCAYCEGAMRHVAPADIEHFRPKAGVKYDREEPVLVKPGYYWLAAEWDNLLPSCIDCNRGRTQLTPDDIDDGEVRGKENFFPLTSAPDSPLDHRSWVARDDNRRRLLLHPCRDWPEAHLEFHFNGTVTGTTRKGRVTISVLGLDRLALNRARRELVLELAKRIRTITVMMRVLDGAPEARLSNELEQLMLDLEDRTLDQQPFAAMARTVVDGFHAAIRSNRIDAFVVRLFTESTREEPAPTRASP